MLKTFSILSIIYYTILPSAFAGNFTVIGGDDDEGLKYIAQSLANCCGRVAPAGWQIQKEEYTSERVDNVDGGMDKINFATIPEIMAQLEEDIDDCNPLKKKTLKIKRLSDDEIKCEFETHIGDDYGVGIIHRFYKKFISLKRNANEGSNDMA
ncbi:MAG: hypothetical protein BGO76_03485 [Caedibacter sp. 38-128]|nr:hypothetical protein [Holosporales bacterium]OJX07928.1 MAG: hypothetical protein BGO76_03485 [Caedibacter sp. 38-128]